MIGIIQWFYGDHHNYIPVHLPTLHYQLLQEQEMHLKQNSLTGFEINIYIYFFKVIIYL